MTKKKWLLGGGVLGVLVLVAAVWFVFFKDDAPDAVTSDAANADLDAVLADDPATDDPIEADEADEADEAGDADDPADADDPPESDDPPDSDDAGFDGTINGNWIVNDEIGNFDFETASGSFAGFRVAEELVVVGDVTAVGRSGTIDGSVSIDDGTLTAAEITVDMTTIVSNESRREGAIRRAVGASDFPTATFVFADSVDVSALQVGGDAVTFSVVGELTVKGTTQPVTFEIEANVREDGFAVITGSTGIVWLDFGVTPPTAASVVSVADEGIVEFQLVMEQG